MSAKDFRRIKLCPANVKVIEEALKATEAVADQAPWTRWGGLLFDELRRAVREAIELYGKRRGGVRWAYIDGGVISTGGLVSCRLR